MAEDGLEYVVKMRDEMSGPAHAEKEAVDHLTSSIKKNSEALKEHKGAAEEAGGGLGKLKEGLSQIGGKLAPEVTEVLEGFGAGPVGAILAAVAAVALLYEGVKELGELLIEGTKFAIEAAEFKEDAIAAYTAIKGTSEEGEAAFEELDKLGRAIHMPTEKVHALAKTLMLEGLEDQKQVLGAVEAVSNLQRAGLEQGAQKFQGAIEKALAAGHFEVTAKMLKGTGASLDDVYAQLAKRLGESVSQVKAQMKAGKIAADVGIAALEDAVNGSKVAEIAAKKFTLQDAVTDLKNSFRAMFQDVDVSPLMQALRDFVSIFDAGSASSKSMKEVITDVFSGIIRWVSKGIEAFTLLVLHAEIIGLKTYIALFPIIDIALKIEHAIEKVVESILGVGPAAEKSGNQAAGFFSKLLSGGTAGTGVAGPAAVAPAHAAGGLVKPAPGEAFASVAPGEMILPSQFAANLPELGPANSNAGGDTHVHVDVGGIAVHGVTDLASFKRATEAEMADVFERIALEGGR